MMSETGFWDLVKVIMGQGYDEERAAHFASLIGDMPLVDSDGKTVVEEDGKILARLDIPEFRGEVGSD